MGVSKQEELFELELETKEGEAFTLGHAIGSHCVNQLADYLESRFPTQSVDDLRHGEDKFIPDAPSKQELDVEGIKKEIRRCAIGYVEEDQDIVRVSVTNISEAIASHFKAPGLIIPCDKCGEILTEQGSILFEPTDDPKLFKKTHICGKCRQTQ